MIFRDSLPLAKSFLAPVKLSPSLMLHVLRFLVVSLSGPWVACDAAAAIRTQSRHRAQISRILSKAEWKRQYSLFHALKQNLFLRCQHEEGIWVFILDQTYHSTYGRLAQNTSSRANKSKRSRGSERRQKKTPKHSCHCFVFGLLISPQTGTRIPYLRPHYTKKYCLQRQARNTVSNPAPSYRTQTELAAELIRTLPIAAGRPVLVLGDTAFEGDLIQKTCRQRQFDWITPANPERVLAGMPGQRPKLRDYCKVLSTQTATSISLCPGQGSWYIHQRSSPSKTGRHNYSRRYWAKAEALAVHNVGTVQVVFSSTDQPQEGSPSEVQKILLCNRLDWDVTAVVQAYCVRWQIEQFFREAKSDLGMSSYRVRDFEEVETWVEFCCLSFVYLEWYRLEQLESSGQPNARREWWYRQRTRGLARQVQLAIEEQDVLHLVDAMKTEANRNDLLAALRRALPLEQRSPA